ncbi:hypothetical protein NDU88_008660 [Pleurodeles waltl]|uniref:Uncharacterized protein n=1 Tax=Pleurodeles waltl TaxID=8319 RepID=A0AAV7N7Y7_PLEWA|nr:hypothetical protein NDU88_008660 [Pleurodeles waltl]
MPLGHKPVLFPGVEVAFGVRGRSLPVGQKEGAVCPEPGGSASGVAVQRRGGVGWSRPALPSPCQENQTEPSHPLVIAALQVRRRLLCHPCLPLISGETLG